MLKVFADDGSSCRRQTGVAKKDQIEMTSFLGNIDHRMFLFLNSGKKHQT